MGVGEFARATGVRHETVLRWVETGWVRAVRHGPRIVILTDPVKLSEQHLKRWTVVQFAEAANVSQGTVRRWMQQGRVKWFKFGGRSLITSDPPKQATAEQLREGMTAREYAEACGVTASTVHKWVNDGRVKHAWFKNRIIVLEEPPVRDPRPGMSSAAFAAAIGVSVATTLRWVQDGVIEHQWIGGRVTILSDPETWQPVRVREGEMAPRPFAEACGVHLSTVMRWIHRGEVEFRRAGGRYYVLSSPEEAPNGGT